MRTWVLRRFRGLGQGCLLLGVFLSPLAFNRATLDVFNLAKLWVLWVFALLAALFWVVWSIERGIWVPRFKIAYAAAAFLLALALATAFSVSPSLSSFGRYHRYGGFIPTALYVLVMLVAVGLYWEHPGRLRTVAGAVVASGVLVAGYAVLQGAGLDPIDWTLAGANPRLSLSTLGNPNFAGGYLAICLPFVVYLMFSNTSLYVRRLGIGVFLLWVAGLWFAGSRGGMVGAGAGMLAMGFFRRDRLKPWMKRAIGGLVLVVMAVTVLAVWHPGLEEPPAGLGRLQVFRKQSLIQRQAYWRAGWRNFLENPVLGTGPDTFYSVYGRYRAANDKGVALTDKPHNIFVEYASNTGIIGLGAYAFLAGLALRYAARAARSADEPQRGLVVAFGASFVAYLGQGLFSIDVPPLAAAGWLMVAGIAVLADPKLVEARKVRETLMAAKLAKGRRNQKGGRGEESLELVAARNGASGGSSARLVQGGAVVVTVGLIALGYRPLLADIRAKTATALALEAKTSSGPGPTLSLAIDQFRDAIRLNPLEASYRMSAAQHLFQRARSSEVPAEDRESFFREALWGLRRANQLEPDNVYILMSLGRLHARWARQSDLERFKTADVWWRRAVALDPQNWQVNYHFGAFLNEWGLLTQEPDLVRASISPLRKSARIRPDVPYLWRALGQSLLAVEDKQGAQIALARALSLSPKDPLARKLMDRATAV